MTARSEPFPVPCGVLRSYDAYAVAEDLGIGVGFEVLPDDMPSVLLRTPKVVLIQEALSESGRHDELTHQLMHMSRRPRFRESPQATEDAVRRAAARRLVPLPALLRAVSAVIAEDEQAEAERRDTASAAAAAQLLGVEPCILRDRVLSLTPTECRMSTTLIGGLRWPRMPGHRYCVQLTHPPMSWLGRVRHVMHWPV